MSELGIITQLPDDNKYALIIISSVSLVLLFLSVVKIAEYIKNFEYVFTTMMILFIHVQIALIFTLRLTWGATVYFDHMRISQVLDATACIMLTGLGHSFGMLWLDIYYSSNNSISESVKSKKFLILSVVSLLINIANVGTHLLLASSIVSDRMSRFVDFNILNNIVAFLTSCFLIGCAIVSSKYIRIVYSGSFGANFSKRILFISFIISIVLEIKAIFPLVVRFFIARNTSFIGMLIYYTLMELLPLLAAFLILKVEQPDEEDYLPESLFETMLGKEDEKLSNKLSAP